jgi:hypothetical protein
MLTKTLPSGHLAPGITMQVSRQRDLRQTGYMEILPWTTKSRNDGIHRNPWKVYEVMLCQPMRFHPKIPRSESVSCSNIFSILSISSRGSEVPVTRSLSLRMPFKLASTVVNG